MSYSFDSYGWLSLAEIAGRTTEIEPPQHGNKIVGDPFPNFISPTDGWTMATYYEPPAPPPPVPPVWTWYIDLGPFYDRFGAAKMAVLTSADVGIAAIIRDVNIRKWVDLQRPDVAEALVYIGTKVPAVTPALQTQILTTPVTAEEQYALRTTYFP